MVAGMDLRRTLARAHRRLRPTADRAHRVAVAVARALARGGGRDDGVEIRFLLMHAWGMGGTIRTTLKLAGELARRHEVEVISIVRRRDEPFFPFPPGVRVTAVDDHRRGRPAAPIARRVQALLRRRRGLLMSPLDRAHATTTLWTDARLVRRLRRVRSGVLIGTRPGLNLMALDFARPGVVAIGQEHMHLSVHSPALRNEIARRYPGLGAVVVLTTADEAAYRRHLRGRGRVVTIPNAAPPVPREVAPHDRPVVLGVGRLTYQKAFDRLIRAFAPVAAAHPEWRLRICGAGPRRTHLRRVVRRRGLQGHVELPGAVEAVADEMARAAVFALSSRFEGFPMALLEAMSAGLAIASFDSPTGPGELLEDGRSGLLVPEGDEAALSAALERLVADPDLRSRLGARARAAAREYGLERIGERWEELLRATGARLIAWAPVAGAAHGPCAAPAPDARAAAAPAGARGRSRLTVSGSPKWTSSSSSPASSS